MLFVVVSRNGVLEQDLYELVNASFHAFNRLGHCRCSWQMFCSLAADLAVLVPATTYGSVQLRMVHSQGIGDCLGRIYGSKSSQKEAHLYLAYHYRAGLHFLQSGAWYGQGRRAVLRELHPWFRSVGLACGLT